MNRTAIGHRLTHMKGGSVSKSSSLLDTNEIEASWL